MTVPRLAFDESTGMWYAGRNAVHGSKVLGQWLAARDPQAMRRAGFARRNYAAAQQGRLNAGWSATNYSANASIHQSLDVLRARSRQLAQDSPHMRKFLQMVAVNTVGPNGFVLQARATQDVGNKPDSQANRAIESAWRRWCARGVCEVSGLHSFASLQAIAAKAAAREGEVLIRLVRGSTAANAFGLALQLLDVDRLDTQLNRVASDGQNAVRMGIEIDTLGRPVAYWLRSRHPGDTYGATIEQGSERHLRVPASEILHAFVADRPEQVRGVPWAHAAMGKMHDLDGYSKEALIAARVGASKMGFFTTPDGQADVVATANEAGGAQDDADNQLYLDAEPGTFHTLPEGVGFQPFNPEYPTAMYDSFVRACMRDVATGLGVAYHSLGNDLEGVNFSSIRAGTLEERDAWMLLQGWFVDAVLEPIFREWLPLALGMGQITLDNGSALPLRKLEKFQAHVWQGRRWDWVDPQKDIEADLAAVRSGLKSPQMIAAKMGQDYEDVLDDIRTAQDLAAQKGVQVSWTAPPPAPGPKPATAQE